MFDSLNPKDLYNVTPSVNPTAFDRLPAIAKDQTMWAFNESAPVWSPENPLFWVGGLMLAVFGLVGFTTVGRVGPVKAGVSVGKT